MLHGLYRCIGLLLLLVGLVLSRAYPAWSEPAPGSAPPLEQPVLKRSFLGADDIASEKVSQFVRAYLQVLELLERRESELQGAETESEFQRIQQDLETEAFGIIQSADLTSQEYLQLLGLANTDPEFGERVAAVLQENGG